MHVVFVHIVVWILFVFWVCIVASFANELCFESSEV
jgi:hypothetical protein